jgi:hypothetical protein
MALQPKVTFVQQPNGIQALLNEVTGDYSEFLNPGGYGPENIESSDVTSAVFTIKKSNLDQPVVITFTIASNVITQAVVTDEFGNDTDVTDLLSNTVFPLENQYIDSILLYATATQELLASGAYYCSYVVSDGVSDYSFFFWQFFTYNQDLCVQEATTRVSEGTITEDQAIDIFLQYDLLCNFIGLSNAPSAIDQMVVLDGLCKSCGCCSITSNY